MKTHEELSFSNLFNEAFTFYYFNLHNSVIQDIDLQLPKKIQLFLRKEELLDSKNEADKGHSTIVSKKQLLLDSLITCFKQLASITESLSLISVNEEITDISTSSIKYLFIPYILANLCTSTQNTKIRLSRLNDALIYYKQFLLICERIEVGRKEDFEAWQKENSSNPFEIRTDKIQRALYKRNLDEQIKFLFQDNITKNTNIQVDKLSFQDEETERNFYISLIKSFICDSVEQLQLINKEIPLLQNYLDNSEKEFHLLDTKKSSDTSHIPKVNIKPWSIKLTTLDESSEMYRKLVFQPGHRLPTMTLAEYADFEMERLKQQQSVSQNIQKELSELQQEEKEIYEARKWDDYTDQNPRGSGNKNRNIG